MNTATETYNDQDTTPAAPHTATYSPEDDKIRVYPAYRLDKEEYSRIKAAGYSWAPKQECFYAVWSPYREAIALEFAGEIEDEDKSLIDRAEDRADRFETYSDNRAADADRAHKAVKAIADNIPFGQPILVGHHSEKRARKDAQKIENGMRYAVKMWETSEYWSHRAAAAIAHARYKERPDVRQRRIKGLEADRRKQQRTKADAEKWLQLWSKEGLTLEEARHIANYCHLGVAKNPDSSYSWSAYDVLRPEEERYKACPAMTVEQVVEVAKHAYPRTIAHCNKWIDHISNRITYERAMLQEAGGTAADQVKPEKGGLCKCWATDRGRGCWSKIIKVNKVSVTVLDNWGNGGENFTRTMPFDKLTALMSVAQVEEMRAAGRIIAENERTVIITEEAPAQVPKQQEEQKPEASEFEAMKQTLKEGIKVVSAPQLFPTPPELAARMVELADIEPGHSVLEPSAGTGNILEAIQNAEPQAKITAVEINRNLVDLLQRKFSSHGITCQDFLEIGTTESHGHFDRILMNPPFESASDIKHILHALKFLKPGGTLVAICAGGPRQTEKLQAIADYWEPLPAGTFANQGTMVNSVLLTITA